MSRLVEPPDEPYKPHRLVEAKEIVEEKSGYQKQLEAMGVEDPNLSDILDMIDEAYQCGYNDAKEDNGLLGDIEMHNGEED